MSQSGVTLCASALSNKDRDSQGHFCRDDDVDGIGVAEDVVYEGDESRSVLADLPVKGPEMGGKIDVGRFLGIDGTWFLPNLGASGFCKSERVSWRTHMVLSRSCNAEPRRAKE